MYEFDVSNGLLAAYKLTSGLGAAGFVELEGLTMMESTLLVSFNFWFAFRGIVTLALPE